MIIWYKNNVTLCYYVKHKINTNSHKSLGGVMSETNNVDKNLIVFISFMMSVLQALEECDSLRHISQRANELNTVHVPVTFYPVKAQSVEPGMLLWDVTSTTPRDIGIVERVEVVDDITEIFYLDGNKGLVKSNQMMFSCCRPNLIMTKYKNCSKYELPKPLLLESRNKDLIDFAAS